MNRTTPPTLPVDLVERELRNLLNPGESSIMWDVREYTWIDVIEAACLVLSIGRRAGLEEAARLVEDSPSASNWKHSVADAIRKLATEGKP